MQNLQALPSSPPDDGAVVVSLASFRRKRRLSPPEFWRQQKGPPSIAPASAFDRDYAERMKANAVIFIFAVVLVCIGVWLMNGLVQT